MTDAEAIIVSSAVVLPEELTEDNVSATQSNKRRASNASNSSAKRIRVESGDVTSALSRTAPLRKATTDIEERKRGKRLFGGLLGALSQNSSSTAQKRRVDIERKQQNKLEVEAEENKELKRRRLEKLKEVRLEEQRVWEEQARKTRHDNERALAHFLKTKSLPALYYRPWELREEEQTIIKQQVEAVDRRLEAELHPTDPQQVDSITDVEMVEPGPDESHKSPTLVGGSHSKDDLNEESEYATMQIEQPEMTMENGNKVINGQHKPADLVAQVTSPDAAKDGIEGEDVIHQGDEDAVLY